jgi:putative redox protein
VAGTKIKDEQHANRLTDIAVTFTLRFPDGEDGDKARELLPEAVKISHERLCTVSRTLELGTPIGFTLE